MEPWQLFVGGAVRQWTISNTMLPNSIRQNGHSHELEIRTLFELKHSTCALGSHPPIDSWDLWMRRVHDSKFRLSCYCQSLWHDWRLQCTRNLMCTTANEVSLAFHGSKISPNHCSMSITQISVICTSWYASVGLFETKRHAYLQNMKVKLTKLGWTSSKHWNLTWITPFHIWLKSDLYMVSHPLYEIFQVLG